MSVVSAVDPKTSSDKLFTYMLIAAGVAGMGLSLASAGYLLAFNVNTLLIATLIFGVAGMAYVKSARDWKEQLPYVSLAIIPITLRMLFNLPIFQSYVPEAASASMGVLDQALFAIQVVGLWCIVAVAEEAFRACMMRAADGVLPKDISGSGRLAAKILVANVLWILFHFIQRPLDPWTYRYYIAWLFISGILLGLMIEKVGLGCAALTHFLINLTA
ncbi:MAG: CPBP family glutamic-type intramembrane protease [Candidatus Bathyarchaeia archaeon]